MAINPNNPGINHAASKRGIPIIADRQPSFNTVDSGVRSKVHVVDARIDVYPVLRFGVDETAKRLLANTYPELTDQDIKRLHKIIRGNEKPDKLLMAKAITHIDDEEMTDIGFIATQDITPTDDIPADRRINALYVNPDYRRFGVGTLLLANAFLEAQEPRAVVTSSTERDDARAFFFNSGFETAFTTEFSDFESPRPEFATYVSLGGIKTAILSRADWVASHDSAPEKIDLTQ